MSSDLSAWSEAGRNLRHVISQRLASLVIGFFSFVITLIGAWISAGLIAQIFAVERPLPVQFTGRNPDEMARRLGRVPMFGMGPGSERQPDHADSRNGIELLGVVSSSSEAIHRPSSERGWALLRVEGVGSKLVRAGEEVRPGLRLLQVQPEAIVVESGAVRSQFEITLRHESETPAPKQSTVTRSPTVEGRKDFEIKDM